MEFVVEDEPDPSDIELLEDEIRVVASAISGLGDERELAVFVREDGRIRAGITGWTWGDACEMQSLWVAPDLRGQGLGTRLLALAADEARTRGCTQIVCFTYDFQGPTLYERLGFEVLARVENFPSGSTAFWMRLPLG